ncbi:MAG TPA: flagellar biosynthetic protein FliO [Firmicutes bacterium]|jgi:flagellar biosynthetic protein FliO|nr:flagellar biosynthetic protein FliO [Bacillota bacterium]HOQ23563.1 flagellar biosynthetic protein FliO [Bacillota bacterium]HPT67264.1 flagellar biosynthetic protein FliO [Bacillota bacterium]
MIRRLLPIPVTFFTVALPAMAAVGEDEYRGGGANIFYALLVFIVVLVLAAYGTRWIAKLSSGARGRILRIAESVYLGPNRGLHLVLVGKKLYLVGQGDHGMNLLAEIDDEGLVAQAEQNLAEAKQGLAQGSFSKQLQQLLAKDGQEQEVSLETTERLLDKLRNARQQKARGERND